MRDCLIRHVRDKMDARNVDNDMNIRINESVRQNFIELARFCLNKPSAHSGCAFSVSMTLSQYALLIMQCYHIKYQLKHQEIPRLGFGGYNLG